MTKVKKLRLKPSVRDKRRYFIVSTGDNKKVEAAILEYVGVLGMAKSNYMFVKKRGDHLVGSCGRDMLNDVRASLAFKGLKIDKVSGTLAGLER